MALWDKTDFFSNCSSCFYSTNERKVNVVILLLRIKKNENSFYSNIKCKVYQLFEPKIHFRTKKKKK